MKRQIHDLNRQARDAVQVAILLPRRHWAGSVQLTRELLQVAGTLGARSDDVQASEIFAVRLVGASRRAVASFGGLRSRPDLGIDATPQFDVVVLPAQFAPIGERDAEDLRLGAWLVRQHRAGALVLSLGGAVLLAKSGLLDGREATGLVSDAALFSRHFPHVRYRPAHRVVADADIVTVCGIGPTVDACAHLVDRFYGRSLARRFLRHTSTDALPDDQHVALWSARLKRHGDAQVLAVQELIERDLRSPLALDRLAARVGMSARTLSRRFGAATGLNLRRYGAALRLEHAEHLMRSSTLPLAHVALECGFGSASALSRAFTARFGLAPTRCRAQRGPQRR